MTTKALQVLSSKTSEIYLPVPSLRNPGKLGNRLTLTFFPKTLVLASHCPKNFPPSFAENSRGPFAACENT